MHRYDNSLRIRRAEETTDAILKAALRLTLAGRFHSFTIQRWRLRRAYPIPPYTATSRHGTPSLRDSCGGVKSAWPKIFPLSPTRWLSGVAAWVEQAVPVAFSDKETQKARSFTHMLRYLQELPTSAGHRDTVSARLVDEAAPHVNAPIRRTVTVHLRILVSLRTWAELGWRHGLTAAEATQMVSEGVRLLVQRLDHLEEASQRRT